MQATTLPPPAVSLKEAFLYWLKLGFISFGGPAGQIALMHAELVEKRRWISEARFLHALNYCMLLPGPEATQLAVYIGWLMHKTRGGIMAGVLFILPSMIVLILLSWVYMRFGNNDIVRAVMAGIKPAIVAIVVAAAWRIGQRTLKSSFLIGIAAMSLLAIAVFKIPFPAIIVGAALLGFLFQAQCNIVKTNASSDAAIIASIRLAIIDDNSPTPAHAKFSWKHLLWVAVFGIACAGAICALLIACFGKQHPLMDMAWFFTKTALLCFGGAYAVLPYVVQGAVEHFHWLNASQMIDGLALGETTPGPLIMIVAFVGFLGGWNKAFLGTDSVFLAASLAASVSCFFTFLPSFIFILAGGPLVESTRNNLRLSAPLNAISAAVVGVILSLALFFASHVFYDIAGQLNYAAIALAIFASIAIFRYQVSTIHLLLASAIAGIFLPAFH
ncbi:chromate efflux transporter [Undibacterium sp. TJN19]|uniref:chromate efflux transporter n=1 Tax=Undibacterium sp. TJN19 TaxID=3413055 RepID=UPI003BEFC9AF